MKGISRFVALAALSWLQPAVAAPAAASAPAAAACRDDVKTLCPGITPGEGRIAACLKDKRKDLSPGCKAALAKARRGGRKED